MHPTSLSLRNVYQRSTYCSLARSSEPLPSEGMQDVLQMIDRILSKICLCPHDLEELSFLHRRVDHLERGMEIAPERKTSSLAIVEKVQNKIKEILSASECLPGSFISLYYLSQFSEIAPPGVQITRKLLDLRKQKGTSFDLAALAGQLPCCISETHFTKDLNALSSLIGGDPNDVQEVTSPRLKPLRIREKRQGFLDSEGSNAYPTYLDALLEGEFFYLYEHLLKMIKCKNPAECKEEIKKINASTLSHILLEARQAIIGWVEEKIPLDCTDVVLLVGNTGSGKSTTLAFLSGESLERHGSKYVLSNQKNLISDSSNHSQTFLPNVRVTGKTAYVDFPGFKDTRGFLINWGIELAFKALIACYQPKIVVVASITSMREDRGDSISTLGESLQRLLGPESALCKLALTQYLRMEELISLENAQTQKGRLEKEIQQLKKEIQDFILQKVEKLEKKVQELEKLIDDLEKQESLSKIEQQILKSSRKKLKNKREELARLQTAEFSEEAVPKEPIQQEILSKEEMIKTKSKEITQLDQVIKEAEEAIKKKEGALLEKIGIKNAKNQIIRLDYLDHSRLDDCQQSLVRAKRVSQFCRELCLEHKEHLIGLLTYEFKHGILPPPKKGTNILSLQNRILETSLIDVLTNESFSEIGKFLHLSEMDRGCIDVMDKTLVEQFKDLFIFFVVTGLVSSSDQKGSVEKTIEELIENFNQVAPENLRGSLSSEWNVLKEAVLFNSRSGASTWKDCEKYYQSNIGRRRLEVEKVQENHLKEWDDWALQFLPFSIKLPEFFYRSSAQASASKLANERAIAIHNELLDMVKKLQGSLRQFKDLEKIIAYRTHIDQTWDQCQFSSSKPSQFMDLIEKGIAEVKKIYNQGEGDEQTGPWERRIDAIETKAGALIQTFSKRAQVDGFLAELMMLEIRERGKFTDDSFIEAALTLAVSMDKWGAQGAKIALAALSAASQRKAVENWKEFSREYRITIEEEVIVKTAESIIEAALDGVRAAVIFEEAEHAAVESIRQIAGTVSKLMLVGAELGMGLKRVTTLTATAKEAAEIAEERAKPSLLPPNVNKVVERAVAVTKAEIAAVKGAMTAAAETRVAKRVSSLKLEEVEPPFEREEKMAILRRVAAEALMGAVETLVNPKGPAINQADGKRGILKLAKMTLEAAASAETEFSEEETKVAATVWIELHKLCLDLASRGEELYAGNSSEPNVELDSRVSPDSPIATERKIKSPIEEGFVRFFNNPYMPEMEPVKKQWAETLVRAFVMTAIAAEVESGFPMRSRSAFQEFFYPFENKKMPDWALIRRAEVREKRVQNWISRTCLAVKPPRGIFNASKKNFMHGVREINDTFAKHLDLDLQITLHRFLLLAVLNKNRCVNPPGEASGSEPRKDMSLASGFEREL